MVDAIIVKEWLDKAEDDFRFAESNLLDGNEYFTQICFHFQQAGEKYLKAYIINKGLKFDKVHDLVHLLRTCANHESLFGGLKEECITLNTAYIETRYPVHWPTDYSRGTAEQAHIAAEKIREMVHDHLNF